MGVILVMKRTTLLVLTIVVTYFTTKNVNAQNTGVPDTLAYLQTIVANKSQYIGQPFSVLQNSLQIQIKFFQPFAAIHHDKTKETSTSFAFYFPSDADELYLTFPKLEIYWQVPLNIAQSDNIRSVNNNRGQWNAASANFYANGIIADIKVRE